MIDPQPDFPPRLPADWEQWSLERREEFSRSVEEQSRSAQASIDQRRALVRSKQRAFWEQCLGDRLPAMMSSRALTEQGLLDADPTVRLGAIKLINGFWKPISTDDPMCRQLVELDPDPKVRAAAAYCWGDLHEGTRNHEVCVALARIAKDAACHLDLRYAAYVAFHQVLGRGLPFEVLRLLFTAKKEMPDLDWSDINSFMARQR